jgi:type 1 fimbriae regulatory protein FimB
MFTSERGGPMTRSNVSKMIQAAGDRAGLPHCHPHALRHTCGHLLADAGHDTRRLQLWLGHSDIKHTARYSVSAAGATAVTSAARERRDLARKKPIKIVVL